MHSWHFVAHLFGLQNLGDAVLICPCLEAVPQAIRCHARQDRRPRRHGLVLSGRWPEPSQRLRSRPACAISVRSMRRGHARPHTGKRPVCSSFTRRASPRPVGGMKSSLGVAAGHGGTGDAGFQGAGSLLPTGRAPIQGRRARCGPPGSADRARRCGHHRPDDLRSTALDHHSAFTEPTVCKGLCATARPRLGLGVRSALTPLPRVSTPSPHDLHTISRRSRFGRLLRHILAGAISDVLIRWLGDRFYRRYGRGEGGMS